VTAVSTSSAQELPRLSVLQNVAVLIRIGSPARRLLRSRASAFDLGARPERPAEQEQPDRGDSSPPRERRGDPYRSQQDHERGDQGYEREDADHDADHAEHAEP
jgi:hypothetical protein